MAEELRRVVRDFKERDVVSEEGTPFSFINISDSLISKATPLSNEVMSNGEDFFSQPDHTSIIHRKD